MSIKKSIFYIVTIFILSVCFVACANINNKPVNVLMIEIDDLGWIDTSIYGSHFYETPNIDRLAAEGVRFTQFYESSPVCSPTRASLMTGKHPARLEFTNIPRPAPTCEELNRELCQAYSARHLQPSELTIGEAFRDRGYATGYVGKWHLGDYDEQYRPVNQGFDFNFGGRWPGRNTDDAHWAQKLTDASLEFIEDNRSRPFFLVLSHYLVHTPLQATPEIIQKYEDKAATLQQTDPIYAAMVESEPGRYQDNPIYAAMVENADRSVGQILDKLEELGLDKQTIVVFTSDNGGLIPSTSNFPLRRQKGWLYEGGIRVPLILGGAENL